VSDGAPLGTTLDVPALGAWLAGVELPGAEVPGGCADGSVF
jgi:hypothetical protein